MTDRIPGFIPRVLTDPSVTLFRADERVFDAMVDGWCTQMLARGLATESIKSRNRLIRRFQMPRSQSWIRCSIASRYFSTCR